VYVTVTMISSANRSESPNANCKGPNVTPTMQQFTGLIVVNSTQTFLQQNGTLGPVQTLVARNIQGPFASKVAAATQILAPHAGTIQTITGVRTAVGQTSVIFF